ncbi:MAG: ATP-binding cassette domain-containing protein [Pseudohongiella nitratireducens]|nr:ATP-binding cassette domain-containing protein [Pseudohongiella nitratireducens]
MTPLVEPVLKISQLVSRVSANTVLRVSDLTIGLGQHWVIYGQNGSGKSLLAAYLLGQLPLGRHRLWQAPTLKGRIACVSFDEQQQLTAADRRHDISEYSVSAHDEGTRVCDLLSLTGTPGNDQKHLISALGIDDLLEQGIRFLSSGQLRRVMIARAISLKPVVLILDSPLDSIDAVSAATIQMTLTNWMGPDKALIELSRSIDESVPGCTHMALMSDCEVVATGSFTDIHRSSQLRELSGAVLPAPMPIPEPDAETSMHTPDEVIRLAGVSASYGTKLVIDRLDWLVRRGQHVLIEGPNGCGKSTLLSILTGENNFAYGQSIWLFGQPWGSGQSVWDIKKHFGVVSNHLHLSYGKGWSVLDVVCSGFADTMGFYGQRRASQQRLANAWLSAVHSQHLADSAFDQLSFGQQKLILLARSLVKTPPLLILDEPLVGLDDYHRRLLLSLLARIAQQNHTQLLYVSHTVNERPAFLNRRLTYLGAGRWQSADLKPQV